MLNEIIEYDLQYLDTRISEVENLTEKLFKSVKELEDKILQNTQKNNNLKEKINENN